MARPTRFILAAVLLSGCASTAPTPTPTDFALVTAERAYRAGAPIRFSLTNGSDAAVWYQFCAAYIDLERDVGDGEYQFVEEGTGRPDCILSLKLLPAQQTEEGVLDLADDLQGGLYRLATRVYPSLGADRRGPPIGVATPPFEVLP